MTPGFRQLLGVGPRRRSRDHAYTEVNSGHRPLEQRLCPGEAVATARPIPHVPSWCVFLSFTQGEHPKNLFQKEKVLYTSAAKAGEFCLRWLCLSFLTTSAPPAGEGGLPCAEQGGKSRDQVGRKRNSEPRGPSSSEELTLLVWLERELALESDGGFRLAHPHTNRQVTRLPLA